MTAQTILPANTLSSGFDVANSCRFDGSTAFMTKSPSSNGSTSLGTISVWIKKSARTQYQTIFQSIDDGENYFRIRFRDDNRIDIQSDISNSTVLLKRTVRVFDDPSAWYHIVVKLKLDEGNNVDKVKLFVNGVQETSFTDVTDLTSTSQQFVGAGSDYAIFVGKNGAADDVYFGGYMAEFVYLDGVAADPTSFGEFDEDSPTIWKPIDVSGLTYGTNGFYLDFEDSSNLGNDKNGGTDLSETGLAAVDQCTDTCTNNFCTLTNATKLTDATISEGNCNVTYGTASTRRAVFSTIAVFNGKWYCETKVTATSQTSVEMCLGISNTYNPEAIGNALVSNNGFTVSLFPANGSLYIGTTRDEQNLGNLAVNDIVGMAIDMDNGTLQFYKNGSALGSANDITTGDSDDGELYPGFTVANSCSSGGQTFTAAHNFGNPTHSLSSAVSDSNGFGSFEYAPPSGFYAICTKNLAQYG